MVLTTCYWADKDDGDDDVFQDDDHDDDEDDDDVGPRVTIIIYLTMLSDRNCLLTKNN